MNNNTVPAKFAKAFAEIEAMLRPASIALLADDKDTRDPLSSWYFQAVARPGEGYPMWNGKPMTPFLQIRVDELTVVPPEFANTKLVVVFFSQDDIPQFEPHGDGWLIRTYASLEGLKPLPPLVRPAGESLSADEGADLPSSATPILQRDR